MKQNIPVYDYIGHKLLKAKINRDKDGLLDFIGIKVNNGTLIEENVYVINIIITIKYNNNDPSELIFESSFKINDLNWKEQVQSPLLESLFLSVTFPYIRSNIYSITDDIRGGLNIPIIDLRNVDVTTGIKLTPNYDNDNDNEKNK